MRRHIFRSLFALVASLTLDAITSHAADALLANLSTRGPVGTGNEVMIGGFVISGGPKQVVIRAIGPGLAPYGVPGLLADPVLTLYDAGNAIIGGNDDWNAADAATFSQVGAFAIATGSRDAAMVTTLAPGAYTAIVTGMAGTTGIALVEIYDVDGATGTSRLVNLSTRAFVGTNDSVLIPGLVIANGTGRRRVLVRAAGPALGALGVPGTIADPTLAVLDSAGVPQAANDNWGTSDPAPLNAMVTASGAFAFTDTASRDAALIIELNPGSYTIQVSGVGGTTGVALVEVYEVTPTGPAASITIAASDAAADESGTNPATYTISRSGDTTQPLLVRYSTGGTALNGIDYLIQLGTAVIPAGQSTAAITISPTPDVETEPDEQVSITLVSGLGYTIAGSATASATIANTPPTLYVANLRTEATAISSTGYGTATILLNAAGTLASVNVSVSGLSSDQTTAYLRLGPPGETGAYILSLPLGSSSGTTWQLTPSGGFSSADLLTALQTGLIYVSIETVGFPTGELRGAFILGSGSQTFSPPPEPPAAPTAPANSAEAARFLTQGTFGARTTEINALLTSTYSGWITAQMAIPASLHRAETMADFAANNTGGQNPDANGVNQRPGGSHRQAAWWKFAVTGDDQLRQRVAFALSEIFVVSDQNGTLNNNQEALAHYYDLLAAGAFGNFRQLLEDVSLSPVMGVYLSHLRNAKANAALGTLPDENYAREIMQLFSIGLVQLQPDGTLKLDSGGLPIPTYDQTTISETARVFTGWSFYNTVINDNNFRRGAANFFLPMVLYPTQHEPGTKTIVGGTVLPANQGGQQDLEDTLDTLFNHPNVAPLFARQMIQRLVSSNPSPAYVYRVARAFENNGSGVRGDIGAVVRAILLDYEARTSAVAASAAFGKLKEPLLRHTALLRAFNATQPSGRYNIANPQNSLSQAALRSPTVFNFFEPAYVQPGLLAAAGLYAPEYQILTDSTAISVPNFFYSYTFGSPAGIALDTTEMLPLVATPDQLVDRLALLLSAGALSPGARARIIDALAALPGSTSATDRVRTAIYLTINSPDAATQR